MIFDEYLPYTFGVMGLAVLLFVALIAFMIRLEKTKDERQKRYEERKKDREAQLQKREAQFQLEEEKRKAREEKEKQKREAEDKTLGEKRVAQAKVSAQKRKAFWGSVKPWVPFIIFIAAIIVIGVAGFLIYKFALDFIVRYFAHIVYIAAIVVAIIIFVVAFELYHRSQVRKTDWEKTRRATLKAWKAGLGEVIVRFKEQHENGSLLVRKTGQSVFLEPKAVVYQYFDVLKRNIENRQIEKVLFRFSIKKAWLLGNNMKEDTVRLQKHSGERWQALPTRVLRSDDRAVYFEAEAKSLSHFAITGVPSKQPVQPVAKPVALVQEVKKVEKVEKKVAKKVAKKKAKPVKKAKPKKDVNTTFWTWMILGIFVVAVLAAGGIALYSMSDKDDIIVPEDPIDVIEDLVDEQDDIEPIEEDEPLPEEIVEGGIPAQEWAVNTDHTLDLNEFFVDPDGDSLLFTHSTLNHITVDINDGIATLTPDESWTGTETVVIYAEDGRGGLVNSNRFRLTVSENAPSGAGIKTNIAAYANYIIIGVLILVVLILIIEFRKPLFKFLKD